jgi:hypothetical protein
MSISVMPYSRRLDQMVGREDVLRVAETLMASRMVTNVGVGSVGKTTAASRLHATHRDAPLCDLYANSLTSTLWPSQNALNLNLWGKLEVTMRPGVR